jgi:ABC-type nitrate/sulfonate/bicarbonate transport system substrate-binding protein
MKFKRYFCCSLAIASSILVVSCNNLTKPNNLNPSVSTSPATSPTTIRVGYLPVLSGYPLYTAISEGYFKEAGLDVQMRTIKSGPEGNEALAANNIDVAFSIVPSLVVANVKKVPNDLVSIYGASLDSNKIKDHRIIIAKKSPLTSVKDLRGKKIAVVGYPGRTSDVLELLDHLKRNGSGEKDVQLIGMPHAAQVAALESGTIDAAACAEPYITIGLQSSVKTLGENEGFYYRNQPTEVTSYLARESWLKANPEISKKFIAALAKGLEKSKDREWLLNTGLPSFNAAKNPSITFVKLTPEQSKKLHLPEVLPAATENGLKYVSEQLLRHGPIKESPKNFGVMLHQPNRIPVSR